MKINYKKNKRWQNNRFCKFTDENDKVKEEVRQIIKRIIHESIITYSLYLPNGTHESPKAENTNYNNKIHIFISFSFLNIV